MGLDSDLEVNSQTLENPVKPPILISDTTITRHLHEGWRYKSRIFQTIAEARAALGQMPEGKQGIVLGSGSNTLEWKAKGWQTLDIDPYWKSDFILDANRLESVVEPGSQDYIYAEHLNLDRKGVRGVGWGRLLQQANLILKEGGILFIRTGTFENSPISQLPPRDQFAQSMAQHGFSTITELHLITEYQGITHQDLVYYGRKMAEGFDPTRAEKQPYPPPPSSTHQ